MESKESIDLDLSNYLLAVKRHWIPAVSIFATTVALSIVAASFQKPTYQAEGRLLFKNPTFKVVGSNLVPTSMEGGESGDLKSLTSTQNPLGTQIEIITSRPLLQQTIDRLQLKDERNKPLEVSDLQTGLTSKIVGGSDILQINYKSRDRQAAAKIVNTLMNVYLENDIRTSRAEAGTARLFMDRQLPQTLAAVNQAEAVVRKFKQEHNIVDLSEEAKSAVGVMGNLDTSINAVRSELEQVTAQSKDLYKKINLNSQEAMTISAISQSPAIQGSLNQLQDVERQLATESSRFSETNPIIISLKEKQSKLSTLLQSQIQTAIGSQTQVPQGILRIGELKQSMIGELLRSEVQQTGLVNKLTSLQNSRAAYEKRVGAMPQLLQTQRQLERQLEVSQSTYQTLLKKVQELQLAQNKNISNARILTNAAIPKKPESGKQPLIWGLGMLLGALLGTSAIAYLESRDKSLKTVKEIEKIFGYTLLGSIPANKQKSRKRDRQPESTTLEVAVRDTPQSLTSEMSRDIQANLRFLSTERPLKTIAISSSIANEGKSKVAANLAAAIAGMGHKVLLIDADLRVPYQHRFWKLPLAKGLSDLLMGKSKKFKQILWTVMENLDVLTAGTRPHNPLSCLESQQMKSLINEVTDLYDFVIIDTPPILVASDVLSVGQIADGLLLVARPGVIDANSANAALEKLKMAHTNVLGLIVNGVIAKNESADYFSATEAYFSVEPDLEAPWTDYMTQLGETIADRSRQETRFTDPVASTTMFGKPEPLKRPSK
ncbi:GumC family protein [Chamaesiphon sp.]|uniref:GumC family protein n=1 Tax=Chamaesiphon sp. TaxID=2814140 RepID=UPI003592F5E4